MTISKATAGLTAIGTAAVVTLCSGIAAADPPFVPDSSDLVGVGSDTTQDVLNALAAGYNSRTPTPANRLASWDATGSPTIVPAQGCAPIARPDGSSAGIAALRDDTAGCLEFARSSRAATPADTGLRFVPFAADAVSWVKAGTSNAPTSLSRAELRDIYTCAKTRWTQVGGTSAATIIPILPNPNSGTRAFFLTAISATTTPVNPGACVVNGVRPGTGTLIQENDARELSRALPPGGSAANALLPYSVAKYVFQGKPRSISPLRGSSVVGNIDPIVGTDDPDPVTGARTATANTEALNTAFTSRFRRTVYNVIELVGGAIPTKFASVFGRNGYICSTAGDAIVRSQGFGVLAQTSCGYL
jgi:PBP superfamily domain